MGGIWKVFCSQGALAKEKNREQRHIDHPQLQPLIPETTLSSC